mmetsp:Transcript_43835/g.115205  ORF Transcript_43835/g.115205 Transcript_43835/m.115205 type:complete len:89 (-) Transcript_43835:884-1150(-)
MLQSLPVDNFLPLSSPGSLPPTFPGSARRISQNQKQDCPAHRHRDQRLDARVRHPLCASFFLIAGQRMFVVNVKAPPLRSSRREGQVG